jgi:hypothetical protein
LFNIFADPRPFIGILYQFRGIGVSLTVNFDSGSPLMKRADNWLKKKAAGSETIGGSSKKAAIAESMEMASPTFLLSHSL